MRKDSYSGWILTAYFAIMLKIGSNWFLKISFSLSRLTYSPPLPQWKAIVSLSWRYSAIRFLISSNKFSEILACLRNPPYSANLFHYAFPIQCETLFRESLPSLSFPLFFPTTCVVARGDGGSRKAFRRPIRKTRERATAETNTARDARPRCELDLPARDRFPLMYELRRGEKRSALREGTE